MWKWILVCILAGSLAFTGCSDDDGDEAKKDGTMAKLDAGKPEASTPDQTVTPDTLGSNKAVGDPCTADKECKSGACASKKCAKLCTTPKDCSTGQHCGSRARGKPAFCHDRKNHKEMNTDCAKDYKCTTGLKCYYSYLSTSGPYCTTTCTDNTDCSPKLYCKGTTSKYCAQRKFCTPCDHDDQCPTMHKCIKQQGGIKFCSRGCTKGGGECPRFADCKDVGGTYQCVHKSGSCSAAGKHCDPCNGPSDCTGTAMCITLNASWGYYCGQDCKAAKCPTDNKCYTITGSTNKQCWPDPTKKKSCVTLASSMDAGDLMDDFSMVGYTDGDKNGSLSNDKQKLVKLSDYASTHKVILFVISAGWCGPCKTETKLFASWIKTYEPKGLMIFQTLSDGTKKNQAPTPTFLKSWISTYNAVGAIGIDPKKMSTQYNTKGTIPMNMMLDAKTRKVLVKWNGGNATKTENMIKQYLLGITPPDSGPPPAKDAGVPKG